MIPAESQSENELARGSESGSAAAPLEASSTADDALTADLALAAIKDRGLSSDIIEQISRNAAVMKSRKVRVALAAHPRTPRRIALRLIRELYTFDLMQFALIPAVAADLKRVADELLVARLASITLGERIALAHRSSAMVASAGQGITGLADCAGKSTPFRIWHCQGIAAPDSDTRFRQSRLPSREVVAASRDSHGAVTKRIHAARSRPRIRAPLAACATA
jgi:hypothetical protein